MKEIYEMKGAGRSIRGVAGDLGIARNTVPPVPLPSQGQVLNSLEAILPRPWPRRTSKLAPYTKYVDGRAP